MAKTKTETDNQIKSKEIKIVDIDSLILNPKNNNKHPEQQINQLSKIIQYQGFRTPIIVSNRSGFVVAGHARIESAKKVGMKKVPVIFQDFDSEAQEYAHLVADNAIASQSELDLSMVNLELGDLGPDFNIEMLGLKNFSIVAMATEKENDESGSENNKHILRVELPNELELRDLYDDLISKGYMVKEL